MPLQHDTSRARRRARHAFGLLAALGLPVSATAQAGEEIPLEAFATLGSLRNIQLSPGGGAVAYLYPLQGRQVVIAHPVTDTSDPLVIPLAQEAWVKWFHWLNDEQIAVAYAFNRDERYYGQVQILGGSDLEQSRLFAFRLDGSDAGNPVRLALPERGCGIGSRLATRCPEPFHQDVVVDWLPDDPDHILTAVDGDVDNEWEVREVRVKNGKYRVVRPDARYIRQWITDQTHEVRLGLGRDEQYERTALYRNPEGDWVDLSGAGWLADEVLPVQFERDTRYAIAVGPVNYDTRAIVRLDLVEDRIVEVLHENPDFDLLPRFHDGELIGYVVPARDNALELTDPEWQRMYTSVSAALPGQGIRFLSWTADRGIVLLLAGSDVEPGMVYVWDREHARLFALGRTYPDLDPQRLAPMESLSYEARDGLEISAYLTRPRQGQTPPPLVVMPHGGPFGRDTWGFDFLVQMLASRGYAVLQPNFRGSVYQGREFQQAGEGEWGRAMQDDLTDAVQWMVGEGLADADRVCIVGWSYGGYAALMGAAATPELYRCAASINGVSDLTRLRGEYSYDRTMLRRIDEILGTEGVDLDDYSPVRQAKRIRAPVLVVHAKDDGRVPFEHGQSMARALERAGGQVEFVPIERGDHALMDANSRLQMLQALEAFLDVHLGSAGGARGTGRR